MYNLADFSLQDMTACSTRLRRLGTGAISMEDVANRLVRYLYERLIDEKTRKPACALVRLFRTQAYGDLSTDCQAFAQKLLGDEPASPDMTCLALLATAGERPEWNQKERSQRYKAIPLISAEFVARSPMLSQLFSQLGVNLDATLRSRPELMIDADEHTFNVFYVPDAIGNPFVPVQQEFVIPFGVRSVLGFGGLLPSGDLFVVVLFTKILLSRTTADLFKPLTLNAKLALLPFDGPSIVQDSPGGAQKNYTRPRHRDSQIAALEQLLAVHEEAVMTYATERKQAEAALQSALTRLRTLSGRLEVIREEERGRIARELHDEFGVGLTCLKIDLSRLKALMGNTVGLEKRRPIEDKIRSMEEFIDATIGGVQRIVSELRPAILDDLGLVAAIEWQAEDFQRRTGIACTLHVNEDHLEIDSERATVVFRICQEALTNVARHANATAVGIRLEAQQGSMILEVADNGRGIAEEKIADPRALGLLGMRERAELFGGFVTIAGRPEAGTIVTLHVRCSRPSSVVEGS